MRAFLIVLCCVVAAEAAPKPKNPRPSSSMNVDKEGQPLPYGKVNLLGNKMDFRQFMAKCQVRSGKAIKTGAFDWQGVRITGPITKIIEGEEGGWQVLTKINPVTKQWDEPVTISLAEIGGNEGAESSGYRVGNMVCVHGIIVSGATGGVSAWHAELLPPGLKWETKLRTPPQIVAGTTQTYWVDCVVKNTGAQPLRNIDFSVRLKQVDSPNDEVETYTIPGLAPGESTSFTIDFDWYNFQVLGKTSIPIGAAKVTAYDL